MLPKKFFDKDVILLAKDLLGCELVHKTKEGTTSGIIVETEAYHQTDEASHSYRGKTKRTEAMFGPAGHAYIYFTYGMHWCFNITAEADGTGAGVLIRALEPKQGIKLMKKRRAKDNLHELCSGPSKLVQALAISQSDYGKPLYQGNLYLNPKKSEKIKIAQGPRIGIRNAKHKPWRFWLAGSPFISR